MIIADINLLLPALRPGLPDHQASWNWLERTAMDRVGLALADVSIAGLIRISTNRRAFADPVPVEEAFGFVDDLIESGVTVVHAGPRHWRFMREILAKTKAPGDLVSDAHLAAIAIENGARIATRDRDFMRFAGVDWFDPIEPGPE